MRWPLARRSTVDHLERKYLNENDRRRSAERAAANAGHRRDEALREVGELASHLRLLSIAIEMDNNRQAVTMSMRMSSQVLLQGFRHNGTFKDAIAMYVERMFYENIETRDLLRHA